MAGPLGSSGGAGLMEKSKLSFKSKQVSRSPKLDDAGGGGGIGNKIRNGGGGGGDDEDDDDYFNEGDDNEGEESIWWHRVPLTQLYDAATVKAVLSEWCLTVEGLPGFLRMLASMQYYSTAQWVRYLTMQERPSVFRTVERTLARFPDVRSGFVGRMLADPAFMQKTMLDGALAAAFTFAHEVHVRGKRIGQEADYALTNVLCVGLGAAVCSALVAPSKAPMPPSAKFPWQGMLNRLPNNAFEKNTPTRNFALPQRVSGFLAKGVELSAVNAIAGGASAGLQQCIVATRRSRDPKYTPVTPVPGISRAAAGMGVYGALAGNSRLQLAAGLERTLLEYAKRNTTWQVMGLSTLFRATSQAALENPTAIGPPAVTACSRSALHGTPTQHVPTPRPPAPATRKVVRKVRRKVVPADGAGLQSTAAPQGVPALA